MTRKLHLERSAVHLENHLIIFAFVIGPVDKSAEGCALENAKSLYGGAIRTHSDKLGRSCQEKKVPPSTICNGLTPPTHTSKCLTNIRGAKEMIRMSESILTYLIPHSS